MRGNSWRLMGAALVALLGVTLGPSQADDPAPAAPPAAEAPAAEAPPAAAPDEATPVVPAAADDLGGQQDALALRYKRFKDKLEKLHEYSRKAEPERAQLLARAREHGNRVGIDRQMQRLTELLNTKKFGDASEQQEALVGDIQALLDLLMSEDRDKELAAEKKRIEDYIKDLNKLIAGQKDVRKDTERGQPGDSLAPRQDNLEQKTRELRDKMERDDSAKQARKSENGQEGKPSEGSEGEPNEGEPSEGKPSEGKPSEGKPTEGKPTEGKPEEGKPEEGQPSEGKPEEGQPNEGKPEEGKPSEGKPSEGKPSEGKPSEGKPSEGKPSEGKPSEGKPSEGEPSEGEPSEGKPSEGKPSQGKPSQGKPSQGKPSQNKPSDNSPQDEKTPGREELERAREEMEKAIEKLKKNENKEAGKDQDNALKELQQALQKLEEILRQLREEERQRFLRALEERFQRMLAVQLAIYNDTVQLDKIPADDRQSRHETKSVALSRQEAELVVEANKALTLLREEGSAVAFPEAVQQMRDDMQLIVGRLEKFDVAELTQAIELDVIEALKEMIEALQKEMDKKDEESPPSDGPPPPEGEPQDPELVEVLAELKMLRSLQLRVNGRTQRLGRTSKGEQATTPDVVQQLKQLSERQARIQKATHDLATGRNK